MTALDVRAVRQLLLDHYDALQADERHRHFRAGVWSAIEKIDEALAHHPPPAEGETPRIVHRSLDCAATKGRGLRCDCGAETPAPEPPPLTDHCLGVLVEGGFVVCKCNHGNDGICGFQAEPPASPERATPPIAPLLVEGRTLPMSIDLFERECLRMVKAIPLDDPLADLEVRELAANAVRLCREFTDYRAQRRPRAQESK